jgi:hypothetical protein
MAGCDYDCHDRDHDHDHDHCCEYYFTTATTTTPTTTSTTTPTAILHHQHLLPHSHTRKPCPSICLPLPRPVAGDTACAVLVQAVPHASSSDSSPPAPRRNQAQTVCFIFHSSLLRLPCLVYHASMCQSAPVHSAPARSPEPCSRANSSPSPIQILPTLGLTLSPGCALHAQAKPRQSATRCRQP